MQGAFNDVTEREITFDVLRKDEEALHIDVTSCRFAEFFRASRRAGTWRAAGLPLPISTLPRAAGGEVSLDRSQTIMQGAPSCTFRYKFAAAVAGSP